MPTTHFEEGDGGIVRARQLRRGSTPAERKLWQALRGAALDGLQFPRQQGRGPFFGDFVCPAARLIVELDGEAMTGLRRKLMTRGGRPGWNGKDIA